MLQKNYFEGNRIILDKTPKDVNGSHMEIVQRFLGVFKRWTLLDSKKWKKNKYMDRQYS